LRTEIEASSNKVVLMRGRNVGVGLSEWLLLSGWGRSLLLYELLALLFGLKGHLLTRFSDMIEEPFEVHSPLFVIPISIVLLALLFDLYFLSLLLHKSTNLSSLFLIHLWLGDEAGLVLDGVINGLVDLIFGFLSQLDDGLIIELVETESLSAFFFVKIVDLFVFIVGAEAFFLRSRNVLVNEALVLLSSVVFVFALVNSPSMMSLLGFFFVRLVAT